ncbi:hypothetical protein [Streptomyces sp. NPDC021562]|uniref:hypothetical protein n=1 Tax=Streptomyces sp. NPDC021562 TaxID=3155121 RepID=UPI0034086EC1
MSASPAVRSLRAAVFAAVCVLLAAAGHGLAMGDMPPLWADLAAFGTVFAVGRALAGRERGLPEIGAGMLLTQGGLHVGFDAAHPAPMAGMPMSMPPHGHAMAATTAQHAHLLTAHATLAHVLAALAASWWLRRGEAALWSLLRRTAALVPGLVAWWHDAPLPAPAGGPLPAPARPVRPRLLTLRHAVSRRGPPSAIPYAV